MVQSRPANSSASRLVKVSDADQYIDTGHVGYADLEVERRGESEHTTNTRFPVHRVSSKSSGEFTRI